ncbi:MAG: FadR/GntR family transcriptional regulator [Oscillospiraceae bacterium]
MENGGKLKKAKLYEEIVDELLMRIGTGILRPGDKLPSERDLAETFNVSRAAIREAIRSLEHMGCIESRIGDGTYIKSPTLKEIIDPISMVFPNDKALYSELIEVRLILETEIATLAARRRTREQLEYLAKNIEEMEKEINAGGLALEQDEAFHKALAEASGNRVLSTVSDTCSGIISRTRALTQRLKGVPLSALTSHKQIYGAIERQDEKAAAFYMRDHLNITRRNLDMLVK